MFHVEVSRILTQNTHHSTIKEICHSFALSLVCFMLKYLEFPQTHSPLSHQRNLRPACVWAAVAAGGCLWATPHHRHVSEFRKHCLGCCSGSWVPARGSASRRASCPRGAGGRGTGCSCRAGPCRCGFEPRGGGWPGVGRPGTSSWDDPESTGRVWGWNTKNAIIKEGRKEMFYLMTDSTHFIYGYMQSDIPQPLLHQSWITGWNEK